MPTVVFSSTHAIRIIGATDNGTTLSWATETSLALNWDVTDQNDDGNLDSTGGTPDFFENAALPYSGYTITLNANVYAIFEDQTTPGDYYIPYDSSFDDLSALLPISPRSTSDKQEDASAQNFCFAPGTLITTPSGECAVESLCIGDLIATAHGATVPVKWVGRQKVNCAVNLDDNEHRAPVLISADSLERGVPHIDLTVSADHGMIIDDLDINAAALVNGTTICFVPAAEMPSEYTYYHIETEAHDVILANGAPAETFVDAVTRSHFDNYQEYLDLYGTERIIPEMNRPRISSQRLVPQSIKDRLGIASTDEMINVA